MTNRFSLLRSGALLVCLGCATISSGEDRPRVGLALGGGGARGVAHIGVLQALEKLGIPIDYIAGTSMGAVVGGLYASGMSPQEIETHFRAADWRYLLSDAAPRASETFRSKQRDFDLDQNLELSLSRNGAVQLPEGLVAGRKLLVNLRQLTLPVRRIDDFDRLPIPFRAIATNIETGKKVVLGHGNLAEAMRASMAVPGVFSPYRIEGEMLVDGGLTSNLPIETVQQMGADIVIAVDVAPVLLQGDQLDSVVSVTNQMLDILIGQNREAQLQKLRPRDVHVRIELPGASSADFVDSPDNIPRGFAATMDRAPSLRPLAVGPERFDRYLAEQDSRVEGEFYRPISFGQNTILPRVTAGFRTSGGTLPYYDRFALGGFLNLSGYTRAELYDQNEALVEVVYYRELGKLPQVLGGGIFGGTSLEAGNVWANPADIDLRDTIIGGSVFLGADTLIGSLSLGIGAASSGQTAVYLQLGPVLGRGRLGR